MNNWTRQLDGEAWLSFPRIVSEKQSFFYTKGDFCVFFFISIVICKLIPIPRWVSFCYCLKRKSLAGAREEWIKSVLKNKVNQ